MTGTFLILAALMLLHHVSSASTPRQLTPSSKYFFSGRNRDIQIATCSRPTTTMAPPILPSIRSSTTSPFPRS